MEEEESLWITREKPLLLKVLFSISQAMKRKGSQFGHELVRLLWQQQPNKEPRTTGRRSLLPAKERRHKVYYPLLLPWKSL